MSFRQFMQKTRLWLVVLLLAVGWGGFGCATADEPENASSKPWNSPEGWQNGSLPGMMQQPR